MKNIFALILVSACLSGCAVNHAYFHEHDEQPAEILAEHDTVIRNASDGDVITHHLFKTTQPPKATIFILHEYRNSVANTYKRFQPLIAAGYQVFMMEYRRPGKTEFEIPHLKIVSDTVNAIDFLTSRNTEQRSPILLLGQGYGAQPAIYAAHIKHDAVDALLIEGAFTSFSAQAKYSADNIIEELISKVVPNVYSGIDIIKHVKLPTLVIHSVDDTQIPFTMGESLSHHSGDSGVHFWQINGEHLEGLLLQPNEYVQKADKLLKLNENTQ